MKIFLFSFILLFGFQVHSQTPTVGLKNFREFYYSLVVTTGVTPTDGIKAYYTSVMSRLPKDGRVGEMSPTVSGTEKSLAGLFCKEFSKKYQTPASLEDMLQDLSDRFYQRKLSVNEAKILEDLLSKSQTDKVFITCTAMTSSVEFAVKK